MGLHTCGSLWDQSVSKCPNYTKLYKPVGPQPSRNLHHQKQWFEIMSQNFNDGRRNISMIALQFFREQYHCHSVFFSVWKTSKVFVKQSRYNGMVEWKSSEVEDIDLRKEKFPQELSAQTSLWLLIVGWQVFPYQTKGSVFYTNNKGIEQIYFTQTSKQRNCETKLGVVRLCISIHWRQTVTTQVFCFIYVNVNLMSLTVFIRC